MFRIAALSAAALALAGCSLLQRDREDPVDNVVVRRAVLVPDDSVYGVLQPSDPAKAACFMDGEVLPRDRATILSWDGRIWEFCSPRCRDSFRADPPRWVNVARNQPIVTSSK